MNRKDLKKIVDEVTGEIELIADERVQSIQKTLLNLIELLMVENEQLREENQKLKDEINRLKGEQGKPNVRKQSRSDHSSEKDRKPRGQQENKKKSKKKKDKLETHQTQVCEVDPNQLPADARFKGYQSVIVQDISITPDNTQFKKKVYYSPSLGKTFIAELPAGYQGEFGPKIKALVLDLHHDKKMSQSAIHDFLTTHGIVISASTLTRMLTENQAPFHQEKDQIVEAGLASSPYQQMDDTGARVKGKNYYTHILCNALYTAYFTTRHKNRLTIIELLTQGELSFQLDESAYALMEQMALSEKQLHRLKAHVPQATTMNRTEIETLLQTLFPDPAIHKTSRQTILEASAIIAYQQSPRAIQILLSDDAPQFKRITEYLALCWVHDGRHYKKLKPVADINQAILDAFLTRYWDYYHQLLDYKQTPTTESQRLLEQKFDPLFSEKTGYEALDDRIEKTKLKKESLLLVLKYPYLPLHNNTSELGARVQARYRDISLHTMSEKGTQAKDTFMTITQTARKLATNTYLYFYDRVSKKYQMPSLASLIGQAAHH